MFQKLNVTKDVVASTVQAQRVANLTVGAARTCTAADYGRTIFLNEEDTMAIVLPANGAPAGSWIDFIIIGSNTCDPTVATATADTMITINDQQADSVNFGTGERIGAWLHCISNGTYWMVFNFSGTQNAMSVTTA
jgi:hypothetical protein